MPHLRLALLLAALPLAAAAQTPCTGGVASFGGVDYPCSGIDLMAVVPTGSVGPLRVNGLNDIWGWTDPDDGSEYAIVGATNRTIFVDVTDPAAPRVLGFMPATGGAATTWRDMKVYQDHAFVVADRSGNQIVADHGMQVFDLTRLRGLTTDLDRAFAPDEVYTGISSAHNIVINEDTGFAYAVGSRPTAGLPATCDARGFHAINIQTPTSPTFAGCFSDAAQDMAPRITPGYTHDAQCVTYDGPDTDYQGREICLGANEDVVTLFDVSDKDDVVILSQAAYPNDAYTHQAWLTEDQRYLLVDDELDETGGLVSSQRTLVFDLLDLDDPEFSFAYDSGITSIDHNQYTLGRFSYQANYEAGLRVLDLLYIGDGTNPRLEEVAYFDTYPQATRVQFNGLWSVYPYFESGNVIASDGDNGLFVLRPERRFTSTETCADCGDGATLSAPRPNPSARRTTLLLSVPSPQAVSARLYDVTGRLVASLLDGPVSGDRDVEIDTADLPVGVYVVRVTGETFTASQQITVAR